MTLKEVLEVIRMDIKNDPEIWKSPAVFHQDYRHAIIKAIKNRRPEETPKIDWETVQEKKYDGVPQPSLAYYDGYDLSLIHI